MLTNILDWVGRNKLSTALSVFLFAFFVATISLAVESANRQDRLDICQARVDSLETTSTTTSTTVTPITTTATSMETDSTTPIKPEKNYRLPIEVKPLRYHIKLDPDLKNHNFKGEVLIKIDVQKEVDRVVLHSFDLNITEATIKSGSQLETTSLRVEMAEDDTEFLFLYLEPAAKLQVGTYDLEVTYHGSMKGIVGFYSSTLNDKTTIATSKFEPTYARQAFPCFDEPAMKANFTVELIKPKTYIALSNMNVIATDIIDDKTDLVRFDTSVPMSTYLACFIVCDFEFVNDTIKTNGIGEDFEMRVYASKDQVEKTKFSLDVGKKVTEYYIEKFKLQYPLPKLDMIAIPDFVSGAMEHWGLVTFRETNLLFDPKTTSTANQQNIARVVAHEVSHMWFGNLVTMNWWNELWLNEGFASYMQYKSVDNCYKDWKMLDQFLSDNTHGVMTLDGTLNSHPIVQTVDTPDEITAIFDSITYNKGAAVIRMLEAFVGDDIFMSGVSKYLEKYSYKNTITQNLLDEIALLWTSNAEHNLIYIMDTWTKQMGLPVVNVMKESDGAYTLTQKRFLANPQEQPAQPSPYNDSWYIPITYSTDKSDNKLMWFPDKEKSVKLDLKGENLLKININQIGYYRVNYSPEMWKEISAELNNANSKLSSSDRAHLLNDVFSLAEASEISYDLAMDLSTYLVKEIEYVPWSVAITQFSALKRILSSSVAFIDFRNYVKSLLNDTIGSNNTHSDILLKASITNFACGMGQVSCLEKVNVAFKDWLSNDISIEPDSRGSTYYYGIQTTGETEWMQLWDKFIKETDAQEISKMIQALAASRDPSILQRYLTLAWDETFIRSQNHITLMQYVSYNPIGTPLVWDHVRENWDRLVKKFTLNSRVLGTMIPAITKSFATNNKLKEMEAFFAEHPKAGAGAAAREQAKEKVKSNIKWLQTHEVSLKTWLEKQTNLQVSSA